MDLFIMLCWFKTNASSDVKDGNIMESEELYL